MRYSAFEVDQNAFQVATAHSKSFEPHSKASQAQCNAFLVLSNALQAQSKASQALGKGAMQNARLLVQSGVASSEGSSDQWQFWSIVQIEQRYPRERTKISRIARY